MPSARLHRTALVTGATGMVGTYVCERMLAEGWSVRALVRDRQRARWLADLGVGLHEGDVLDAGSLHRAASGCDVIVHAAAGILARGGWEAYRAPNVEGTKNVITAAERSGARLVQVSSVAVYGPKARYDSPGGSCVEEMPLWPLPPGAHYARSKRESEQMVMAAHGAGRIWATAVRPPVIYGKRDRHFTPKIASALRFGIAPRFGSGDTTLAIVHAANVADGIVRAATSDVAGGRTYNLANDHDVTVVEFLRLAGQGMGRPVRLVPVPLPLARLAMRAMRAVATLVMGRSAGVMAGSTLAFLTKDNPFSSERARRELGWDPPVHPREGVPEAFRWAVQER